MSDGESGIASIVAVTRKSEGVAAITKVYTPNRWRGKGCAERLVRRVCREYEIATMILHHDANFSDQVAEDARASRSIRGHRKFR